MNFKSKKWLIIAVILIAVGVLAAFTLNKKDKQQYFTQAADRGDIREVVDATGTISAVTTVQVGSQVSGTVQKLFADFNSHVKKGQVVAQLDPALFQGAVLQAQADLANAQANLLAAKAALEKAKATAVQSAQDYQRTLGLTQAGVMAQQQLDAAKATLDANNAAVSAAQAQVTQADAQVKQKDAAVRVAQTNLNYATISSPVDGTVVARNVDVGQTVAASLQAPTLFVIAQDLTKMQVYVATDESDVGMIKVGQPATFKVDAFPRDTFRGVVDQIRLNATTVQNVVTYTTVVDFDNPDLKLFPGMTAYVTIPVATATNALKVPNGALRYKPDLPATQQRALLDKAGIPTGGQAQRAQTDQSGSDQSAQAPGSGSQNAAAGANAGSGAAARRQAGQGGEQPGGGTRPQGGRAQGGGRADIAIIWKYHADTRQLEPVQVRTGITDHTYTEVIAPLHGTLNPGDQVVVGSAGAQRASSGFGGGAGAPGGARAPGR
ncbi:MAG TPA: efflux RND transporter periplasmic adaptor subunit [Terriglobales bacterium]|nr:efflux RND transporter periplasmic adaptor subunit [Terriglobales bacterium]